MASIDGEGLQLEAKRKDDCSWHPCRVSLSSSNDNYGIIVNFESCIEEDMISNREEALTRLRFRSTALQDGECFHIREGEFVLAKYSSQSKTIFLDALIEKLHRVKHSNRVYCRCTFEIKWLNPELDGETATLPSKSIMRLSSKGIDSHPVLAQFLNALSPADRLEIPPFLSVFKETNCEDDLHGMLEKQIEEISRLADGSKECTADLLDFRKVNFSGRKQSKTVITSHISSTDGQNNFRRSTRNQNKQQIEVKLKKDLDEDKPFLSPLAARAALASLVHELPVKTEFPICYMENRDHENLVQHDFKKNVVRCLDLTSKCTKSDASFQDKLQVMSNPIQKTENDIPVQSGSVYEPSISIRKSATRKSKPKESSYQEKPLVACEESGGRNFTNPTTANKLTDSTCGDLNSRASTRKITRSSVHKEKTDVSDKVTQGPSNEQLISPRLTRSRKQQEKINQGSKLELTCSEKEKKKRNAGINLELEETDLTPAPQYVSDEMTNPSDEVRRGSSYKQLTSPVNATSRLTRSRKQKENSVEGSKQELGKTDLTPDPQYISEDLVTPVTKDSKKRSFVPADSNTELTFEKKKKTSGSCDNSVTAEGLGKVVRDSKSTPGDKTKAKKPDFRFSPRLRFLPRTRSQTKS